MSVICSVIICTHNPHAGRLDATIDGLKHQTLEKDKWELLLVDSASDTQLSELRGLRWHPQSRIVREPAAGLTAARLRGIRESCGELLVWVDDDNVLAPDYLERACAISRADLELGAFGGSVAGRFESPPPGWLQPYLRGLAVSELSADHRTRDRFATEGLPFGAGLCIRRTVAVTYASGVSAMSLRLALGRRGGSLGSGEDMDMVWTAIAMGYWVGRIAALKMTHIIPAVRMTEDYVVRLFRGFAEADILLRHAHGLPTLLRFRSESWPGTFAHWIRCKSRVARRIVLAQKLARDKAYRSIKAARGEDSLIRDDA